MSNIILNASNVLTEKGNLKSAVAAGFKSQAIGKLREMGFEVMPNGRLAYHAADVDNGSTITINLDVTVGLDTNFEKKAPKTKVTKEVEPVAVPVIFGE